MVKMKKISFFIFKISKPKRNHFSFENTSVTSRVQFCSEALGSQQKQENHCQLDVASREKVKKLSLPICLLGKKEELKALNDLQK